MANQVNLVVDQGSTFSVQVDIDSSQVNLASYSIYGSFAKDRYSSSRTYFTSNSSGNTVTLSLGASDTQNLEPGKYAYDVILVDNSNNIVRIIEGQLLLMPNITTVPS